MDNNQNVELISTPSQLTKVKLSESNPNWDLIDDLSTFLFRRLRELEDERLTLAKEFFRFMVKNDESPVLDEDEVLLPILKKLEELKNKIK
jgi:ABC-type thiamine transport system substrate-binding protein